MNESVPWTKTASLKSIKGYPGLIIKYLSRYKIIIEMKLKHEKCVTDSKKLKRR